MNEEKLICGNCGDEMKVGCMSAGSLSSNKPEWEFYCDGCLVAILTEAIAMFKKTTRAKDD